METEGYTRIGGMLMRIFDEEEIRNHVTFNDSLMIEIKRAFIDLVTKEVQMPEVLRVDIEEHQGEMDVKTAYIPGDKQFALKVSTGFFNNYKIGLPSTGGLMMLINATNGQVDALLQDNGYLTDIRTAAAGAIAANYLANENLHTVGVIGAGTQAQLQLEALQQVRGFEEVRVYSKTRERLDSFKEKVEEALGVSVIIEEDAKHVVQQSDLLITATPATSPIVKAEWISPGMHITAMGSDAKQKQELEPAIFEKADVIVCDVIAQCEVMGELRAAKEAGIITQPNQVRELGSVIQQKDSIRQSTQDVTVVDLTGTGAQDTKIALYANEKLTEKK